MYFKKLELVGFKSFCDKTTLHFEPGITAVVGPNGCGKSNIFDSIRWVLGEQSAKSLRGSQMQDVIFNGTDLKEPLGMAEVTLTFDNEKRFFNVDHPEVAITRRIFRSGESEYLLNKTSVRLKDILDILLGTGIGAESYSIVAQGKIDLVLSSRPEDRRLVFDEASGITKYKAQKRETLRKLEETEQNLLRVNDIVTEVKRQIGSLERQANKARRYKEVFEELKVKEVNLASCQKQSLLQQKDNIIKELTELEAAEAMLLGVIRQQEEKISNRQSELKSFEDAILEIRNQILNLENQKIRNSEHIKFNQDRLTELSTTKQYLDGQILESKNKIIQDEEKLNSVKSEYDNIKKNAEEKALLLTEKEARINELASAIKNSLASIADFKKCILDFVAKIASARNEIADFNSKQQIYLARKKRLEIEKAKVFEEKAITEDSLDKVTKETDELKRAVEELNSKISNIKINLDQEARALADIDSQVTELEKQRLTLESHKEFLEKLKTKYNDISEAMNAVIYLDKLPTENVSGLVIKIRDNINFTNGNSGDPAQPTNFRLAGEAKPIELDTGKIDEKLKSIGENLSALKDAKGTKEAVIQEINRALGLLGQDLRNQEIAFANKETSRLGILEQFNKIKEEEDIIVIELNDVQREISVLEQNLTAAQGKLSGLSLEHKKTEDAILQGEESISANGKLREEVLVIITQTKTELAALNQRVETDEATLTLLEDTCRSDRENLQNTERQIKDALTKEESLSLEINECQANISQAAQDIEAKNNSLKGLEDKYHLASDGSGDVAKKIESDRNELDRIKNKLYELQMQNKDIDYNFSSIKERLLAAYKVDLEAIQEAPLEGVTQEALTQEINGLKEKLDSYGTVNLVAIEEYDELKKRYDFLIQQQNDLSSAKESLHQAILKINRTTKEMFMDTFEKVRVEFRNYFRLLFNGGDAQVFLIDENDPLESGIEIICRPPGKKLQNVLLLSGGEKSMSAIALIFAIFKVKPSPFCILDEIDAALDEANVDRFSRILQEFSTTSQFIVVTHNKKTIANANVMYGITMQQSGISKIVSVKFAQDKKEKDKEPDAKDRVGEPV